MRRGPLIMVMVLWLALPVAAHAGTYTWSQPADLTTTPPGSNPEHKYGDPSWSYSSSTGALQFANPFESDLAGWSDNPSSPSTWIALNTSSSRLEMLPAQGGSVTLGWLSPLSGTVQVSGSVTHGSGLCTLSATLNGRSESGTFNTSLTVSSGENVKFTVSDNSLAPFYSQACDTAVVSLTISATVSAPNVTLTSPATGALISGSQPTFSGTASTGFGYGGVTVRVYQGSTPTNSPVETLQATPSGNGSFSVPASPALSDGRYTAVAEQDDVAGEHSFSAPDTFRIKNHAPAVTLEQPFPGQNVRASDVVFSGGAGTALGDSSHVTVNLYRGSSTSGGRAGSVTATVHNGRWSARWPRRLALGTYTAEAVQRDDAGHTGRSGARTFLAVLNPEVVGPTVTLDRAGFASVRIACLAPSTTTCTGDLLVLTVHTFRAYSGGPDGELEVLFSYLSIRGGGSVLIRQHLPAGVARTLRRAAPLKVRVSATLSESGGPPSITSAVRALRLVR